MKITKVKFLNFIKKSSGKIFSVTFVKRTTGEVRHMNCRLGVKSYLKGGELRFNPKKKNLIVVFDMQKKAYRMINLDTAYEIIIEHKKYRIG